MVGATVAGMKPFSFLKKLERSVPSRMLASWIESVHKPNRELCVRAAAELRSAAPAGQIDERAAVHYFASKSARDAFILQFISGRFSSIVVFFFDLHRTERHLSNLAGTLVLVRQPDKEVGEWREEALNYLAGVSPEASRLGRAGQLFRKMALRTGAQTMATATLRRTLAAKGLLGRLSMSGAHALWSYGEVVVTAGYAAGAAASTQEPAVPVPYVAVAYQVS
jgi:hypothetical protein